MKFNFPANNFTSGEWSPKMVSRTDVDQYARASIQLKNAIVQIQGGAFRRPGTAYQNLSSEQTYVSNAGYLKTIPMVLSQGGSYVVVLTDDKPSGGTNKWFVRNTSDNTDSLITPSSNADFADSRIDGCQYAQVGDYLFIVNDGVPPRYLFYDAGTWKVKVFYEYFDSYYVSGGYWLAFPYGPIQADNIDGTISVTGTLTAGGSVALVSTNDQFSAFHVATYGAGLGCLFKFTKAGATGVVKITAYTDSKNAAGVVLADVPGSSGDLYGSASGTAFEKAIWNGRDGWPKTITGYEGRLFFGGNTSKPDTIWASRTGNVFNMMEVPLVQDSTFASYATNNARPFTLTPSSKEASNIVSLSAAKTLVINTNRSEIVAYGTQLALGPLDFKFESSTSYGADRVQPVRVNNYLTFVQRGGRKIRDVIFNFNEDQYKSTDLSFVADHMTVGTSIVELMAAEIGSSVLFMRLNDGRMLCATLDRDYQVNAFSTFELGGNYLGSHPKILAMCSVPGAGTQGQDAVYFIVQRTINGVTKKYMEKLTYFYEETTYEPYIGLFPYYMDCLSIVTPSSASLTGLTYLAGETVQVIANGAYIGEKMISSTGGLELDKQYNEVILGLKYETVIRPVPIEQGAQVGSPIGQIKRVNEVTIRFFNTLGAKYGLYDLDEYYDVMFRRESQPMDELTELYTGDKNLKFPPNYTRTATVSIKSDYPFPCNVICISAKGSTFD